MKLPNELSVWWLAEPLAPSRVGTLQLIAGGRQCAFQYDQGWEFALSPGLRTGDRQPRAPLPGFEMPGVFEDAGPDRWGRLVIERLDRPARLSPLDYLYLSGDSRLGCLGFSISNEAYEVPPFSPVAELGSLDSLYSAILRIEGGESIDERQRRLLDPGRTFGGACPKACVQIENEAWMVKFPQAGDMADVPLIEYCTLRLARSCGLQRVVEARPLALRKGHALAVRRFDRQDSRRFHVISARTMISESEGSGGPYGYDLLADALRRFAPADKFLSECEELFRRMVFNILIDNTDDHEKNHALGAHAQGWVLTPVFDVSPQLTNLGSQAMTVGKYGSDSTIDNTLSGCERFSLKLTRAKKIVAQVRSGVRKWHKVFTELGVRPVDMDAVAVSIERLR